MNTRTSTLGWIGFMLAIAIAIPVVMGSLFTAWRAKVTAGLPPPPVELQQPPAPPPEPVTLPVRTPPAPLSPIEKQMFVFGEFPLPEAERTDVYPKEKHRIDVIKEGKGSLATGAKLDLDRDGKFDEVWTFGRPILRDVSPKDDGVYAEHYRWQSHAWVPADQEPAPR